MLLLSISTPNGRWVATLQSLFKELENLHPNRGSAYSTYKDAAITESWCPLPLPAVVENNAGSSLKR